MDENLNNEQNVNSNERVWVSANDPDHVFVEKKDVAPAPELENTSNFDSGINYAATPAANSNPYTNPAPQYIVQPKADDDVSIGDWIISFIITAIPCVGLIMLFVWAFSNSEKKSKSNWAKARLIMTAIATILSIFFYVFVFAKVYSSVRDASQYMNAFGNF